MEAYTMVIENKQTEIEALILDKLPTYSIFRKLTSWNLYLATIDI